MVAAVSTAASKPVLSRAAQRGQTRARILEAVLAIIVVEGMRSVRHRAVAERAGVSLGSTTYHFSSIEELIFSAFEYWRGQRSMTGNLYHQEMVGVLSPWEGGVVPASRRKEVAIQIYQLSVAYILDQLSGKRNDRIIEMAFYHESMRYRALRELVLSMWQLQLDFLAQVHAMMGSKQPEADAMITSSLFRQLEQTAVMEDRPEVDSAEIRRTVRRQLSLCFGEMLPQDGLGNPDEGK